MFVPILLFAVGLVLLIKGGDWFVDGATALARKFHLPEILIGATVVSIGTTLPEVMVSATSAVKGVGGIAYGNAVGSVICNTSLIAALTIAIMPGVTDVKSLKLPVYFFFGSAVIYLIISYSTQRFSRISGLLLICIFAVYIFLSVKRAFGIAETESEAEVSDGKPYMQYVYLVLGAAFIAVGAWLLVENGTTIAEALGVPDSVIGLTFVALGTSLPELVTAITSLIKGHSSLSLGNIVGANLFNLVLVNGVSPLLAPYKLPAEKMLFNTNAALVVDLPLMVIVMLILCVPTMRKKRVTRTQGIVLLALYAAFCVYQFCL